MGGEVETLAGVGADGFGPGCSFTSLGTITPLPPSGTFGNPASSEEASALAGIWAGGSALERVAHAENKDDAAATISAALTDFFAIPPT